MPSVASSLPTTGNRVRRLGLTGGCRVPHRGSTLTCMCGPFPLNVMIILLGPKVLTTPRNTPRKLKTVPAGCLLGVPTAGGMVRKVWRTSEPLLTMVKAWCPLDTPNILSRVGYGPSILAHMSFVLWLLYTRSFRCCGFVCDMTVYGILISMTDLKGVRATECFRVRKKHML